MSGLHVVGSSPPRSNCHRIEREPSESDPAHARRMPGGSSREKGKKESRALTSVGGQPRRGVRCDSPQGSTGTFGRESPSCVSNYRPLSTDPDQSFVYTRVVGRQVTSSPVPTQRGVHVLQTARRAPNMGSTRSRKRCAGSSSLTARASFSLLDGFRVPLRQRNYVRGPL